MIKQRKPPRVYPIFEKVEDVIKLPVCFGLSLWNLARYLLNINITVETAIPTSGSVHMDRSFRLSFQKERHIIIGLTKRKVFFTISEDTSFGLEIRPFLRMKYPKKSDPNMIEKLYIIPVSIKFYPNIIALFFSESIPF
jgi:hypothetical protein